MDSISSFDHSLHKPISFSEVILKLETVFFQSFMNELHEASEWALIGASLSEPHTSMTAFAEVVCMSVCPQPYTVNFK